MKRILIVDDHEVLRDGVKRVFEDEPVTTIFGEAGTAEEAIKLVREQDWDIVVLDISLGDRSGLQLLKQLKEIRARLPVLILSMHSGEQFARRAFKTGASGYITKSSPRLELVKAVNKVMSGGRYVSAALAENLIFDRESDSGSPHEALSNREFEVLSLIASGKTVREIAELISLSDSTISTYRARILEKMGMRTNAELTHYAIHNRLVE
ncbi:MAG TPA: response regulator transcription factor [Pyrinomonadaceae bacterium]|nr:response regulator transcription factor [Pyrinomonadaceae bacterium]